MKKIIDFFKNLSVRFKFALVYFFILLIQIVIFGLYMYEQTSNSTVKQGQLVMEQNLLQTKESILQKRNSIESAADILVLDKRIQDFLDYKYENSVYQIQDYQFNISPIVENILKQNRYINSIKIYMSENIVTEMSDSYYSVNKDTDSSKFLALNQKKPLDNGWTSTHEAKTRALKDSTGTGEQVLTYSKKIISSNTFRETGTLEIEVKENVLFDMLRDPIVTKLGKIFVADDDSVIVSNNITNLFKKDVIKSNFFDFTPNKRISKVGEVFNKKYIFISIPISEINCNILGIFPADNFNNEIKRSFRNIELVLLFSSIFLGIIIFFTTTALLSRIKDMVKAMKQVRDGNLNVSVNVDSTDEFGELGTTFNHMTSRIHELVETVYKIELMEKEAELKALEAQINPHFLYNTLATITWAARKVKSTQIETISNSLAKFYRLVLSKGNREITVAEEVEMVKAYLHIQKIRFEDKFDVIYKIDEASYSKKIIKNILQPIVENALSHGIEPKSSHGTIVIKISSFESFLSIKIIDDGVGMDKGKLIKVLNGDVESSKGSGYAMKNIIQRLEAYSGRKEVISIYSREGIGTEVLILI
ncbi:sensor histidine kinase [Clostridium folliculivorans]|uniref:Histidine kinase n=1 Tax=Clostridium folliculivorans TaxID=2886038 RepID=A0A9W5Y0M7_9CLOT|nr:sensor histidine kinase [Clostridium folliculivorans]GKU24516.1 histidine kinase [Clostridium folliculivorans]GKU30614.1 histidine kinase [Clostridium folliculivorans]